VETVDNQLLTNKQAETTSLKVVYTAVYNFVDKPKGCEWGFVWVAFSGLMFVVLHTYSQLIHVIFA
jgi:hypothetical protein